LIIATVSEKVEDVCKTVAWLGDDELDKFEKLVNDISTGLPAELKMRRQQYEYYRNKLLTFKEAA
jgi:hypothetical protein